MLPYREPGASCSSSADPSPQTPFSLFLVVCLLVCLFVSMSGIEARASYVVGKCSNTERPPQPLTAGIYYAGALPPSYLPSILKPPSYASPQFTFTPSSPGGPGCPTCPKSPWCRDRGHLNRLAYAGATHFSRLRQCMKLMKHCTQKRVWV